MNKSDWLVLFSALSTFAALWTLALQKQKINTTVTETTKKILE